MDFEYKRKINYYETDRMGVVHHSNYIRFLEEARCTWLEQAGIPMELLEQNGITIPTLEINVKYKYPVTSGDTISIKPKIDSFNGVRMNISYEVIDLKTGNVVIDAKTMHCFTNSDLAPINLKKHNTEFYDIFNRIVG